jgi:hypothetical protein
MHAPPRIRRGLSGEGSKISGLNLCVALTPSTHRVYFCFLQIETRTFSMSALMLHGQQRLRYRRPPLRFDGSAINRGELPVCDEESRAAKRCEPNLGFTLRKVSDKKMLGVVSGNRQGLCRAHHDLTLMRRGKGRSMFRTRACHLRVSSKLDLGNDAPRGAWRGCGAIAAWRASSSISTAPDEANLGGCRQRHVQQQSWRTQQLMPAPRTRHRVCCNAEDARPVGEARKLPFVCMTQRTEIGCELQKRIRLYLLKP